MVRVVSFSGPVDGWVVKQKEVVSTNTNIGLMKAKVPPENGELLTLWFNKSATGWRPFPLGYCVKVTQKESDFSPSFEPSISKTGRRSI